MKWLPIGSVPKDGTCILLDWPAWGDEPVIAKWMRFDDEEGWMGQDESAFFMEGYREGHGPTHWMRLPRCNGRS